MTKSPNESPKAIALKNKLGYPLINSSGEHYLPTAIRVGATIKFATIRNDGTIVTSTRFVTGGSNTHLALKDYTGKADGALNVTQTSRECITCWELTIRPPPSRQPLPWRRTLRTTRIHQQQGCKLWGGVQHRGN